MVLLPWDFGADMNFYRGFIRGMSLTVTFLEALFILWALTRGFALFAAFREIPEWSKIGMALLLAVISWGAIYSAKIPVLALIGIGKIVIHILFFLAVYDQLNRWGDKQRGIVWIAIGIGLLAYWFLWLLNIAIFEPQGEDWVVFVPGVTNVRSLGFFALAGFFAAIAAIASKSTGPRSWPAFAFGSLVAVAALVMVFWTGSRGGLVAILAGIAFLLVFAGPARNRLTRFCMLVFPVAIIVSLPLPVVNPSYGIEHMISRSTAANAGQDISSGRREMWRQTVKKIQERPLAGWGVEQFAVSGPAITLGYKQPHNMFLQLLFSTGLLGAIAVLLIVIPFLPRLGLKLATPDRLSAWGYIAGAVTFGLYDAAFYYTYPVMIFLFAVACVLKPFAPPSASDRSD
jgi:O-antigen ligase